MDMVIYGTLHNISLAVFMVTGILNFIVVTILVVIIVYVIYKVRTEHLKGLVAAVCNMARQYITE